MEEVILKTPATTTSERSTYELAGSDESLSLQPSHTPFFGGDSKCPFKEELSNLLRVDAKQTRRPSERVTISTPSFA